MATTQNKNGTAGFDTAFEQVKDSGEQVLSAARKAGQVYVDSYEKVVDRAIEAQLKVAGATNQEWLKSLIEAQADFTREVTQTYTTTARSFLNA